MEWQRAHAEQWRAFQKDDPAFRKSIEINARFRNHAGKVLDISRHVMPISKMVA